MTVAMVFVTGTGASCIAAKPVEPRVRIDHFKGAVLDAARLLFREHNVPVSIVEATRDPGIELNRVDDAPVELLRKMAKLSGVYRFETIDGHLILYPDDPSFESLVDDVRIKDEKRELAMVHLLEHFRTHAPSLPTILGPLKTIAGTEPEFWSAPVTLKSNDTVIRLLTQLLGPDQKLFFVVSKYNNLSLMMTLGSVDHD